MSPRGLILTASVVAVAALATACGGSSPAPTQTPSGCACPISVASTSAPVGSTPSQASIAAGWMDTSIDIPAATSGSGTVKITSEPPSLASGLPGLQLRARKINELGSNSASVIGYLEIVPSANITLPTTPAFSFTLPASVSTANAGFFVAYLPPSSTTWVEPALGPATVSGQTLTFAAVNTTVSLVSGQDYWFALYVAATPTTSPSATPGNDTGGSWTVTAASDSVFAQASESPNLNNQPQANLVENSLDTSVIVNNLAIPYGNASDAVAFNSFSWTFADQTAQAQASVTGPNGAGPSTCSFNIAMSYSPGSASTYDSITGNYTATEGCTGETGSFTLTQNCSATPSPADVERERSLRRSIVPAPC